MSRSAQANGRVSVGVVGAGQLARMMGEAAHGANVELTVLAEDELDSASETCDRVMVGSPRDEVALRQLANIVDAVTFDHELVDLDVLARLEDQGLSVRPSSHALRFAVDKAHQRHELRARGLPVPRFLVVHASDDPALAEWLDALRAEPVIKTPRGGYDGRGVFFPETRAETLRLLDELSALGDVLVEERLELLGEFAQQVARGVDGSVALYPLVASVQSEGMCVEVRFPAGVSDELLLEAERLTLSLARLVQPVGMMAVEYFLTHEGLVINELALRPHNTGHWTIEGATTSQFTQHLLAVSGQALRPVEPVTAYAVMVNVVGAERAGSREDAVGVPGVFVHDYAKSFRQGRKLGHVTALGDDLTDTHVRAWKSARLYGTAAKET